MFLISPMGIFLFALRMHIAILLNTVKYDKVSNPVFVRMIANKPGPHTHCHCLTGSAELTESIMHVQCQEDSISSHMQCQPY